MRDAPKAWFTLTTEENGPRLSTVYLDDDVCWREVCPDDILALWSLRDQIEMMLDEGGELCFTGLVHQARELEDRFKEVVAKLKLKPRSRE